jgi:hypothetical protein
MRYAIIESGRDSLGVVERYLPSNYSCFMYPRTDTIVICGDDVAGWTLDNYVIPRLQSGNIIAIEVY